MRAVLNGPNDTHHETTLEVQYPLVEYKGDLYDYAGTQDGAWFYKLREAK